jgi:2'-5' RNA ligase
MRLFAAIPLQPPALTPALTTLQRLEGESWPVRWVPEAGLHLTLKFFGEVAGGRLDTIAEMVGFALDGATPMAMRVTGAGVFPNLTRPRVIRLEVSAGAELELLQDRIERGGERIGFPPEGRPFRPHVTMGRVKEGQRLPPSAAGILEGIGAQPEFLADRVVLYESELGVGGPRYHPRSEFLLP